MHNHVTLYYLISYNVILTSNSKSKDKKIKLKDSEIIMLLKLKIVSEL